MKILNLACGNVRPSSTSEVEWTNLDNLFSVLAIGTPERNNLEAESGYYNADVLHESGIPAEWAETFEGVICSHAVEHWTCQEAVYVMKQCRHLLKPGGILLISVPDATYFKTVHDQDTVENAQELFGEPIHLPDGETTFTNYALWNRWHKAILNEDVLWHYFRRAGFKRIQNLKGAIHFLEKYGCTPFEITEPLKTMMGVLNRLKFSLVLSGQKE